MLEWLEQDLKEANKHRYEIPWIITMSHKSLYCSYDNRYAANETTHSNNLNCIEQTQLTRSKLEDLFYNSRVDLILSAHVHNYERDSAIYQNSSYPSTFEDLNHHHNPSAPIHILSGIAGNDHGHEDLPPEGPEWFRYGSTEYGYGKISIINSTHIYWEQLDSAKEQVIDFLWISKDRLTY